MQVQVQVGAATPVPSAAPVLIAPTGAENTPELCPPTTPDACPLGMLSAVVPDTEMTADFPVATVARVELVLPPMPPIPPIPPMPPTAPAVVVALVPAPAAVVPVALALPVVLFNERLIVQEVAAPLPSNWQMTGWLAFGAGQHHQAHEVTVAEEGEEVVADTVPGVVAAAKAAWFSWKNGGATQTMLLQ